MRTLINAARTIPIKTRESTVPMRGSAVRQDYSLDPGGPQFERRLAGPYREVDHRRDRLLTLLSGQLGSWPEGPERVDTAYRSLQQKMFGLLNSAWHGHGQDAVLERRCQSAPSQLTGVC